jgi:hypothetical protein
VLYRKTKHVYAWFFFVKGTVKNPFVCSIASGFCTDVGVVSIAEMLFKKALAK